MEWSRQKCVKMVWMLAIREGTVHKCVPFFTVFTLLGTIKYGNIYKKRGYCDNSLTHRLFQSSPRMHLKNKTNGKKNMFFPSKQAHITEKCRFPCIVLVKPVVLKLFGFFNHLQHSFRALVSELGQKVCLCCGLCQHSFINYKSFFRYSVVYGACT